MCVCVGISQIFGISDLHPVTIRYICSQNLMDIQVKMSLIRILSIFSLKCLTLILYFQATNELSFQKLMYWAHAHLQKAQYSITGKEICKVIFLKDNIKCKNITKGRILLRSSKNQFLKIKSLALLFFT